MFNFLKKKRTNTTVSVPIFSEGLEFGSYAQKEYYKTLRQLEKTRDVKRRIQILERQLTLLPAIISEEIERDGHLAPVITCRDELSEIYMRMGDWAAAERTIKFCMRCNAYYPESGEEQLKYLLDYKMAAETAIRFLNENPGYLQKNIYRALKSENLDDYSLKHFIRCSGQIKKSAL
jgi:hypothetical protein